MWLISVSSACMTRGWCRLPAKHAGRGRSGNEIERRVAIRQSPILPLEFHRAGRSIASLRSASSSSSAGGLTLLEIEMDTLDRVGEILRLLFEDRGQQRVR